MITINILYIHVSDRPQVKVKMNSLNEVSQGQQINLTCDVIRSNPSPDTYSWLRNGNPTGSSSPWFVKSAQPDDAGSYSCKATNSVATGSSDPIKIFVLCKFPHHQVGDREKEINPDCTTVKHTKSNLFHYR